MDGLRQGHWTSARRMLASVLLCYAIVLQALFGALAPAEAADSDTGYFSVICLSSGQGDLPDSDGVPIKAKHHCVVCQMGAASTDFLDDAWIGAAVIDRRAAIVSYLRRQDPATAPLYLPPRVSRGPPFTA